MQNFVNFTVVSPRTTQSRWVTPHEPTPRSSGAASAGCPVCGYQKYGHLNLSLTIISMFNILTHTPKA